MIRGADMKKNEVVESSGPFGDLNHNVTMAENNSTSSSYNNNVYETNLTAINMTADDEDCGTDKSETTKNSKCILKRLFDAEKKMKYVENEDVILALGNTGSGKTTTVLFVAGDNTKLISEEIKTKQGFPTGDYQILDIGDNKIGSSSIFSKTEVPDLLIVEKRNITFYDCPGFSDSRSAEYEITGTYYTKKVGDKARGVKFLIVVNYSSVKLSGDKLDFMLLAKHITNTIKHVPKFKSSIGLVASKVNDSKNDQQVIVSIAAFLQDALSELEKKTYPTEQDKSIIELVKVLLQTDESGFYNRIGFMRTPKEPGPLSDIKEMQENKKIIETLTYDTLKYVHKDVDDFSYTLSDKSKDFVEKLMDNIHDDIKNRLKNVSDTLEHNHRSIIDEVNKKLASFTTADSKRYIETNLAEARLYREKLNNASIATTNLVHDLSKMNSTEFLWKVNSTVLSFGSSSVVTDENMRNITAQVGYLDFFQTFEKKPTRINEWANVLQGLQSYVNTSMTNIVKEINNSIDQITNNMQMSIGNIVSSVTDYYEGELSDLKIPNVKNEIISSHITIDDTHKKLLKTTDTKRNTKIVERALTSLGLHKPYYEIQKLEKYHDYIDFLYTLSGDYGQDVTLDWNNPFKQLVKYLGDSVTWLDFLEELNAKFSTYTIQHDPSLYNVANIADWGLAGKPQGISITSKNINDFLSKLAPYNLKNNEDVKKMLSATPASSNQLKALNNVLSFTLKGTILKFCNPSDKNSLIIQGYFIRLSELIGSNNKLIPPASGCDKLNAVNIYALDTVFLDKDLDAAGQELQLTVIAPKWDIQGKHKLNLEGKPGKNADGQAEDGRELGESGNPGKPGEHGGPGGHYLGIVMDEIRSANNLVISTNGGSGGSGQKGGNGNKGRDGHRCNKFNSCYDGPEYCSDRYYKEFSMTCTSVAGEGSIIFDHYIYGTNGGNGGDGGPGGKGGEGGYNGTIILFDLCNKSCSGVQTLSEKGADARDGDGGRGAEGGYQADNYHFGKDMIFGFCIQLNNEYVSPKARQQGAHGSDGTKGGNTSGEKPRPLELMPHPSLMVNYYKAYLIKNLNTSIMETYLRNMLDKLNTNESINGLYDTIGLVNELTTLEELYYISYKKLPMLPFYEMLIARISQYCNTLDKNKIMTSERRKVLGYLYTATMSKICSINANSKNAVFILIVKDFFKLVPERMDYLKKLSNLPKIRQKISEYYSMLDYGIKDANDLIQNDVNKEIEKIIKQSNTQVDSLIDETIDREDFFKQEEGNILQDMAHVSRQLILSKLIGVLRVGGQMLSFLGPVGSAVRTAIGSTSMITGSIVIDKNSGGLGIVGLRYKVQDLADSTLVNYKEEQEFIKKELDKANAELDEKINAETNAERKKYLQNLKEENVKFRAKFDQKGVVHASEFVQYLRYRKEELEGKKGDIDDEQLKKVLPIVNRLQKAVNVGKFLIDAFDKFQKVDGKFDSLDNDLKKVQDQIAALREYEENFYDIVIPLIQTIQQKVTNATEELAVQSHAALDVSQWKVQSAIKDVQLQIAQMIKGFELGEILVRCTEKLDYAMTVTALLYDRLKDYRDRQELSDYIDNISGPRSTGIQIVDGELRKAVTELHYITQTNLFLEFYEMFMDAFQQSIFPFADAFQNIYNLPTSLSPGKNDSATMLASVVIGKFEDLLIKLEEHEDAAGELVKFENSQESVGPFFIWSYKKNKDVVAELLQGHEITLLADITEGLDKSSIKFKEIGIRFRMRDQSQQGELLRRLAKFQITMSHLGVSYYKCNGRFYRISHGSVPMDHSVIKKGDVTYYNPNDVYAKINKNPPRFSPYTLWKFQLYTVSNKASDYELLEPFLDADIDLELEGNGAYVETHSQACELNLENYYQLDNLTTYKSVKKFKTDNFVNLHSTNQTQDFNMTKTGQRVRRSVQSTHVEPEPAHNSAKGIHGSTFNSVFNWLTGGLALFNIINPISYIKESAKSYYKGNYLNMDGVGTENTIPSNFKTLDLNSTLTLADLAVRFITKEKPISTYECPTNLINVRAFVLDIVTEFEKCVENECFDFDPVTLMGSLEKEVLNGNYKNIADILYQSLSFTKHIDGENSDWKKKIASMLEKKFEISANEGGSEYIISSDYVNSLETVIPAQNEKINNFVSQSNVVFLG